MLYATPWQMDQKKRKSFSHKASNGCLTRREPHKRVQHLLEAREPDGCLQHRQADTFSVLRSLWTVHIARPADHEITLVVDTVFVGEAALQHHCDLAATVVMSRRPAAGPYPV